MGSVSPRPNRSPRNASPSPPPPWSRTNSLGSSTSSGRHSRSASPVVAPSPMNRQRTSAASHLRQSMPSSASHDSLGRGEATDPTMTPWHQAKLLVLRMVRNGLQVYEEASPAKRIMFLVGAGALAVLGVTALVFWHRLFALLGPIAQGWRDMRFGWMLIAAMMFASSIPPIFGYTSVAMLSGIVYGFPHGWPVIAVASVLGAVTVFLLSRTVLQGYIHRMVGRDRRFVSFSQVLKRDGIGIVTMLRFCPLPFSLLNGFLGTIPTVSLGSFTAATILSSPKLLIHVFVGSRVAALAEDEDMSWGTRLVNFFGVAFGMVMGMTVGWIIYKRTLQRSKEIALEEGLDPESLDREALINPNSAAFDDVNRDSLDDDDTSADSFGRPTRTLSGGGDAVHDASLAARVLGMNKSGSSPLGRSDDDGNALSLWDSSRSETRP